MVSRISKKELIEAQDIIARDSNRNVKFNAMDDMFFNNYPVPKELKDKRWFRLTPTTQPSDAVWGATRTLSTIEPDITYAAIGTKEADKERADKIERVLKTIYRKAESRSKSKHTRQLVWNALLYDLVAIQLDFIPHMLSNPDLSPKLRKRLLRTKRFGPFAINVRNAKSVHPVHSEWGLEEVVFEQVMPAREAINYWGNAKLESEIKKADTEWVYILDRMNEEKRMVTAHVLAAGQTTPPTDLSHKDTVALINEDHGLPFLPWIVKGGGSTTESDPERHYRPLLDSIYHSGQAKTVTLMRSLLVSDEIFKFYKPDSVSSTVMGEEPDLQADGPRTHINLRVGEQYQNIPPDQLDIGMFQLLQTIEDDMQRSTAPRILFGDVPSDIAFATYNAGIQAAARTIIPHKEVAEDALVEMFTQMLMWSQFAEEDLTAFISITNESGEQDREQFTIEHDTFDIDTLDIKVELKADIPIDRQARINAASQLYTTMPVSAEFALGSQGVGITDTTLVMGQRVQEDLDNVAHSNLMQEMSKEFQDQMYQAAYQQALQDVQQQMEQEMANATQGGPNAAAGQAQVAPGPQGVPG